ncbi:hypothetical protein BJV82DRAFT_228737 [Fennellomyces sp. T-0311]|nr:hypothetical protein BJV82DRAFT_228737 [Fennellomyces sp. T-0311]
MFGGKRSDTGQKPFNIADLDDLLKDPLPDQGHEEDESDLNDPELLRQLQELTSSSSGGSSAQKAKAAAQQEQRRRQQQLKEEQQKKRLMQQQKGVDLENLDFDSYAALAQGDDDVDVELTEADFTDPTLLKELSSLTNEGEPAQTTEEQQTKEHHTEDRHVEQELPSENAQDLMALGFSRQQAEDALAKYDGNLERASNYLLDAPKEQPPAPPKESSDRSAKTTIETVKDEDDDMGIRPTQQIQEDEEPDLEELQRQSKQYQQLALAAKRQGDKKKAVELLRKSKALTQKYNELVQIQQEIQPTRRDDHMEDVQHTSPQHTNNDTNDTASTPSTKSIPSLPPAASSPAPPKTPSPPPLASPSPATSSVNPHQLLQEIVQLQKEYKEAAHHYKDLGNLGAAKEMVKVSKELLRVAIQVKNGEVADMDAVQRKLPSKPDMTLGDGKIRQIQRVETASTSHTLEHLEAQLIYQIDVCHNLAIQTSMHSRKRSGKTLSGTGSSEQEHFQQLEQVFTTDVVSLRSRRDQNQTTTPQLHYEQVSYTYKNILDHIAINQMELRIVRGIGLQSLDIASSLEPYVTWDFDGWPPETSAQAALGKGETAVQKGSNPDFDVSVQIPIMRGNRLFFRHIQRRKLVLEVFHNRYSYGLFRRPLSLGKIQLPLETLLNKASISGVFDLVDGNRRKTGGKLEVQLNLREPLTGEDIVKRSERWLVLDEFGKNTSQILAAAGLTSGMILQSPSQTNPEEAAPVVVKTPPVSPPAPAPQASPKEENTELEEAQEELNSTDSIISNMVLEHEISLATNTLASGKLDAATRDELVDRKQALDIKMNMLVIQVQTGVLDMDTYLQNVRKRMDQDRQLALIFKKHNRLDLAKVALTRKKIMQNEIDEATAAMAEQEANEED